MNKEKKVDIVGKIPKWAWLCLSLLSAVVLWFFLSKNPTTSLSFPPLPEVFKAYHTMAVERGKFWPDVLASMRSVGIGFALGFVFGVPVAFLMAW